MLVVSRKLKESVVLGDGSHPVLVTLLSTRGKKARIGIHAHSALQILRDELQQGTQEPRRIPVTNSDGFLVLERKLGEKVWIEGYGYVVLLKVQGEKVRLGFDEFPDQLPILRLEVWEKDFGPFTRYDLPWRS